MNLYDNSNTAYYLLKATRFAVEAHGQQVRKYTGLPYITHPLAVADLLVKYGVEDMDVLQAAILHDVAEDTDRTLGEIEVTFGLKVAQLVREVTDVSTYDDGNRATRKMIDLMHLAKASPEGATIKLADLIDNTKSIVAHDPAFASVYLREKAALLQVLKHGNRALHDSATNLLQLASLDLMLKKEVIG